jgi:glycosyltransferase involved in cell wall biosynthesis/SAM-dependent methyltransferase
MSATDLQAAPGASLVITCFNHAHFLPDAIDSALAQTRPFAEIVVVDDGSTDETQAVARRYPQVRYVRQDNRGLSAARNLGLRHVSAPFVAFLDADDRLMPVAVERGIECLDQHPDCSLVYGAHRWIDSNGTPQGGMRFDPCGKDAYGDFLSRNAVGMHATVMYRRAALVAARGFDEQLRACEDYDVYLRLSQSSPVSAYGVLVAEYRQHAGNMSRDPAMMLESALQVLSRQRARAAANPKHRRALADGVRNWKRYYGSRMAKLALGDGHEPAPGRRARLLWRVLTRAPQGLFGDELNIGRMAARRVSPLLPRSVRTRLSTRLGGVEERVPVGAVRLGDLARIAPVSRVFGFDRGLPIDRYYVEHFLAGKRKHVMGRVLEIGDRTYTLKFGGDRVSRSHVLTRPHRTADTTFVSDLTHGEGVPDATFDCVILPQTLHLIFDLPAAIGTLHRILKPGGTLLVTVPGTISQVEKGAWRDVWYWGFTRLSLAKLFAAAFYSANVRIVEYGNVLASVAFLEGLATEELDARDLDHRDEQYPLLIGLRATRAP